MRGVLELLNLVRVLAMPYKLGSLFKEALRKRDSFLDADAKADSCFYSFLNVANLPLSLGWPDSSVSTWNRLWEIRRERY